MQIDFDIHQMIEAESKSFDEPRNEALRRLLKLPPTPSVAAPSEPDTPRGKSYVSHGLEFPDGTLIKMEYDRGNQVYEGQVIDGKWVVDGRSFNSPSAAAGGLAITKKGPHTKLNGWNYWRVKRPGEAEWTLMIDLLGEVKATPLSDF